MNRSAQARRRFIRSAAFGLIGIASIGPVAAGYRPNGKPGDDSKKLFYRYPSMDDEMVSSVVGASHGNIQKVKELVTRRPELAGATWDWGFGDWETALGAASHVGRRDIAELLMSHGARPDIFTFAMMGMLNSLKEIVETVPGIQSHTGPHGITLLQHAKNRLEDKNISTSDRNNVNKVIQYLESLGNADIKPKNLDVTEQDKQSFMGEYRFGEAADEVFVVDQHRLGFLQIGRKGYFGRALKKISANSFSPAGAASVSIIFTMQEGRAVSLAVHEPEPLVTAVRI